MINNCIKKFTQEYMVLSIKYINYIILVKDKDYIFSLDDLEELFPESM